MKIKKRLVNKIKGHLNKMPYVRTLYQQSLNCCFPNGHFYSPVISIAEIQKREAEIWKNREHDGIPGIDLKAKEQRNLVQQFLEYYEELPFQSGKQEKARYQFDNGSYSYTDGIVLYSMIRHIQPKENNRNRVRAFINGYA